jgi:hypothetical protein
MMTFALLNYHGISVDDAVQRIIDKLYGHELSYRREKIKSIKPFFEKDVESFCNDFKFEIFQKEIIYFMIYLIQEEFFVSTHYDTQNEVFYITYEDIIIKIYDKDYMIIFSNDRTIEEKSMEVCEESVSYLTKILDNVL